jgi:hypothetical protein
MLIKARFDQVKGYDISTAMARYIYRKCPKCREYFGLVVNQLPLANGEHPIKGFCSVCGYQLKGWQLILGRKQSAMIHCARMSNAFRQ